MTLQKLYWLLLSLFCSTLHAQDVTVKRSRHQGYQYGFSTKGTIELQRGKPVIRLAANGGIGGFLGNHFFPSYNLEAQLYYGGMGTRAFKNSKGWQPTIDLIHALTLTGSWQAALKYDKLQLQTDRNVPLYYFADFTIPALQNPFANSLSLGTNWVQSSNRRERKYTQRIGFINLHIRSFQLSYYNDGGYGINQLHAGDGKDRGYTGGAIISYHRPSSKDINCYELAYHKFTGGQENAFELSNALDLASVDYLDPNQQLYNKSVYSFTSGNTAKHWGAFVKWYNKPLVDFQHLIHYTFFYSYHLTNAYRPSLNFGLQGTINQSKLYTK